MDNLVGDGSCELEMCLFTALEHLADQGRVQRNQVIMMRQNLTIVACKFFCLAMSSLDAGSIYAPCLILMSRLPRKTVSTFPSAFRGLRMCTLVSNVDTRCVIRLCYPHHTH